MNTIHSTSSLLQLIIISLAMWYTVALACQQITAAYGVEILRIPISKVSVVKGASMVGSPWDTEDEALRSYFLAA
jgi:hypothetical protein